MTHDAHENELQDYLDGRMAEPRRRAFEARMAADDALARRVRSHRERSASLAGSDESLSPDFYVRLRARFEESKATRPRGFRPFSWEAAGLAAAALIAMALFLPSFIDRPRAPVPPAVAARPAAAPTVSATGGERAPSASDKRADSAATRSDDRLEAKQEAPGRRAARDEPARQDADEGRAKRAPLEGAPIAVAEREQAFAPAPEVQSGGDESRDAVAGAAAPAAPPSAESRIEKKSAAGASPAQRTAAANEALGLAAAGSGIPVRPDLVEPGGVVEVDDRAGWEGLELAALGRYDPARRVVLVGDREDGLECRAAQILALADAYEIRLVRQAPGTERDGHGCAFVLPRDARPVRVVGPEGGAR